MHPRRAGSLGTSEKVRDWVANSCAAQGVPVKVVDAGVLASAGTLLGLTSGAKRAKPARPGLDQTGWARAARG
jgi:hypothetical protein